MKHRSYLHIPPLPKGTIIPSQTIPTGRPTMVFIAVGIKPQEGKRQVALGRNEGQVVDDFGYPATTEVTMDEEVKGKLKAGYVDDLRFTKIIDELKRRDERGLSTELLRYKLDKGLLYATYNDGSRRLCIPASCVQMTFEIIQDQKHHFGPKKNGIRLGRVSTSTRWGWNSPSTSAIAHNARLTRRTERSRWGSRWGS
ncbi:hypothetical protein GGR54DRAFT_89516 [Hypoxylon sp. NC1633]|nr:hypothetical protein GGR54DRAFT_89516 [Hypoxylon sp. NC1633]